MHVGRLYGYQRAQARRVLDNDLRYQPGIDQGIVGVDEDPLTTGLLTPARYINDILDVAVPFYRARLRRGGEDLDLSRVGFCSLIHASPHRRRSSLAWRLELSRTFVRH